MRDAVRFADGIDWLAEHGVRAFVELGPDGVLSGMARASLDGRPDSVLIPLLRRNRPEPLAITTALADAHVHGVTVDWTGFFAYSGARRVELPTYAFQRERFWPEAPEAVPAAADPVDAEFWSAVEREDLASLADVLDLDGATITAMVPALSSWRRRRREQSAADNWRYRITWKPLATAAEAQAPAGPWLVLAPAAARTDAWTRSVTDALGTDSVLVEVTAPDREALAGRLRELLADGTRFTGVASLLALADDESVPGLPDVPACLALTAAAVQAVADAGIDAPLWCLTRGAVSVGRSEQVTSPAQAAVWGLGRVIALEHPQRWGGLADLPEQLDPHTLRRLAGVLASGEDQVAVRASGSYGRRLAHAPRGPAARPPRLRTGLAPCSSPAAPEPSAATSPAGSPAAAHSTCC
ncbi:hypothetical protein GCM10020000_05640 [Streptomyces olivoverticillatus]